MTRIIHIAGNSGSGKSILALNLGIALSQRGRETILLDANIYSPDIANYSDISPGVFFNEFLNGERSIEETITFHPSGMKIIPSILEENQRDELYDKLNEGLISLVGKAEIILIDSFSHNPALFSVVDRADETIFVTNDDFPSIIKAKEFIKRMESKEMDVIGVVLNKRRKNTKSHDIEMILGKKVIAEIPYDKRIVDSLNIKQPIFLKHPESKVTKAVTDLAEILDVYKK